LFIPKSWDDDTVGEDGDPDTVAGIRRRRASSKIPDTARHREKWRQSLDMLDEITSDEQTGGWGLGKRPVVADAGYGDTTEFRLGLDERGLSYVLAVKGSTSAYPGQSTPTTLPYHGRGRPPAPRYRDNPTNLTALALAAGRRQLHLLGTWTGACPTCLQPIPTQHRPPPGKT
jgi:hypothetical protein